MKKIIIDTLIVLVVIAGGWLLWQNFGTTVPIETAGEPYVSEALGLSFTVPTGYFVYEVGNESGERSQYAIVLLEDTAENRSLVAGELPGREAPPTITINILQNNLDEYSTEGFVKDTNFSNFKLSNGETTEVLVGGERALAYDATGLYENKNVVIARPAFVYMFTAFYSSPSDSILTDFEKVLSSVAFSIVDIAEEEPPIGGNNGDNEGILPFDSGVRGQVLIGPTCPVVQEGDDSCADKGYKTSVQVFAVGGSQSSPFSIVATDADGYFWLSLPPGEYRLEALGGKVLPRCASQMITIGPSAMLEKNISCDSGIR